VYNRAVAELIIGSEIAGCRIEAIAGRGGMGVVYRATQTALSRTVALKVIAPEYAADALFARRFQSESRIAASIEHPNVIPVHEAGERDGVLYLIMRYVEGTDLRQLLAAEGRLEPDRAAHLLAQVASALGAAHNRGLLHRDVKPANVLIANDFGSEHAYLTDFGIAKAMEATGGMTRTGAIVGTPDYMAPERMEEGGGDARSDVYALGCVLYQSVTGELPYVRDNPMATVFAHVNAPIPSAHQRNPAVPSTLDEVVRRAMAKRPDQRYETASDLRASLLAAAGDSEAVKHDPTVLGVGPPPPPVETGETQAGSTDPGETEGGGSALPATTAEPIPGAAEKKPAPRGRGRGLAPVIVIGAIVLGVVVALLASGVLSGGTTVSGDGQAGDVQGGAQGGVLFDTAGLTAPLATPKEAVPVGDQPESVAVGNGAWVTNSGSDSVTRINAREQVVKDAAIPVGDEPAGIAVGEDSVWVANRGGNSVTQIDRLSGEVETDAIEVGNRPEGIAVGAGAVWVANSADGTLTRIDEATAEPDSSPIEGLGTPVGVAYGEGFVWVTDVESGQLFRIDPDAATVDGQVDVGEEPRAVTTGFGSAWVANAGSNDVVRVDPELMEEQWRRQVAPNLRGIGAGPNGIWTASADEDVAVRIGMEDPSNPQLSVPVEVGDGPVGVAVGLQNVWVANRLSGTVTPINQNSE
jgi:streptogramin lyase